MPEIVEVKVGQARALTGPVKGVPYVIPPMPRWIVKDPWYVVSRSKPAEQAPQRFIER